MSELVKLEPFGVDVPEQFTITYPGADAWLQLDPDASAPGADPAWVQIEKYQVTDNPIPGKPLTNVGTEIDTGSQWRGSGSLFIPTAGSYVSVPASADWAFGSGDFTIEFDVRFLVISRSLMFVTDSGGADRGWGITNDLSSGTLMTFYYATAAGSWTTVSFSFTPTVGTWYHFAFVRQGSNLTLYVNGTATDSPKAISGSIRQSAAPLLIGRNPMSTPNDFTGRFDEIRISNVARYTANFTRTTTPNVTDANTKLLCHFEGADGAVSGVGYYDESTPAPPPTDLNPGTDPAWLEVDH